MWTAYCIIVMAIYWIFECVPLAITALIPVVLLPLTGNILIQTSDLFTQPESIECFIEDQAFSTSYDLARPSAPLPSASFVSLSQSSCMSPVEFTDRRGGFRGAVGAKSNDAKKV